MEEELLLYLLLIKVGNELGLSLKDLTLESNTRVLSDVMDVLSSEMFDDLDITNQETAEFISSNPNIAKALLSLNDAHKSFKDDMQNRLESMDINSTIVESPSRLPVEIVSDFLQTNKNYFENIEKASEVLRKKVGLDNGHNIGSGLKLTNYLKIKL